MASSTVALPLSDSAQSDTGIFEYDRVDPDSIRELDRFIVLGLRRLGDSRQDFISRFGPPDSVRAEPFDNRHVPGQTDTVYTIHYRDVSGTFYHVANTDGDMLALVDVRDQRFLRLPAIQIGMPWQDVVAKFGPPERSDDDGHRYNCRACVVDQEVVLKVRDGRVSAIAFSYYID